MARMGIELVALAVAVVAAAVAVRARRDSARSARAAEVSVQLSIRDAHYTRGPKREVRVKEVLVGADPHSGNSVVLENVGDRTFEVTMFACSDGGDRRKLPPFRLEPGDLVERFVSEGTFPLPDFLEVWFDGDCPCDRPDGLRGHWGRRFRVGADRDVLEPVVEWGSGR